MSLSFFAFATALTVMPVNAQTPGFTVPPGPINACSTQSPAFTLDDLGGVPAPCAVAPGAMIVETLYYQNASRIGGTALAEYPLFRVRAGIARRLEVLVDTPSQIAESGLRGAGLYPTSHTGYGLNYTFAADSTLAAAVGVEAVPPGSRFSVNQAQPRYVIDLTGGYHFSARGTVSAIASASSSREVGFNRTFPAAALRVAYDTTSATQVSTDVGMRFIARHAAAQSYGDVSLNQRLRPYVSFALGIGTTFNPVSNQKAHYLASGFNFRIK
jgi:hypothetical protein